MGDFEQTEQDIAELEAEAKDRVAVARDFAGMVRHIRYGIQENIGHFLPASDAYLRSVASYEQGLMTEAEEAKFEVQRGNIQAAATEMRAYFKSMFDRGFINLDDVLPILDQMVEFGELTQTEYDTIVGA
jgi:hypothetical protein